MVLKAVMLTLKEIEGKEGKWLKFRVEVEKSSISEVRWKSQVKKQLEKGLHTREMSAFL